MHAQPHSTERHKKRYRVSKRMRERGGGRARANFMSLNVFYDFLYTLPPGFFACVLVHVLEF